MSSTSVVLSKKGVNTYKLIAKVTGSNETVVWSTSNKRIATVNQKGVISAKGAGTATITASINGKAVACKVTVRNASFKVSKTTFTIKKGKTAKIKVTVSPKKKVTYKSSSNKIVKVSKNGVVKGVKKGTAQITVTYQGVKQIVNVKVR